MKLSRRDFLERSAHAAIALAVPPWLASCGGSIFDSLRVQLGDRALVFDAGSADYHARYLGFNRRIRSAPLGLALCQSADSIPIIVRWARTRNIPLHLRCGGHAYERASTGEGLIVDVSPLNALQLDAARGWITIGAGARSGSVRDYLANHGLAVSVGTCPSVGLTGLALGGGYGMLTRRFGLTCDALLEARMVDAAGSELLINQDDHADLLWALRGGGGGHFGVVTEMRLRVSPVNDVYAFQLTWPREALVDAVSTWQQWLVGLDDGFNCHFVVTAVAGEGIVEIECHGMYVPLSPDTLPDEATVRNMLQPLAGNLPLVLERTTFIASSRGSTAEQSQPVHFKAKTDYAMTPLSLAGIQAIENQLSSIQHGSVAAIFNPGGGALQRIPVTDTAYAHREALYFVQWYSNWQDPMQTANMLNMMRALQQPLRPYFAERAYVNYLDADLDDWKTAYYAENLPRLQQIKQQYDPEGFFDTGIHPI